MNIVIQLTRNNIFDMLRDFYSFVYTQMMEKESKLKTTYMREMRILKIDKSKKKPNTPYHPFQTLFQIACKFIKIHEPLSLKSTNNTVSEILHEAEPHAETQSTTSIHKVKPNLPQPSQHYNNILF